MGITLEQVRVTRHLLYALFALDGISDDALMEALNCGGFGGPSSVLGFLLKKAKFNNKNTKSMV